MATSQVTLAREFEHGVNDSAIEKPDTNEQAPVEYHKMTATAYCIDGTTATGTHTRVGVAASKRAWFGKTAKVYRDNQGEPGELIGIYTIEDTGGAPIRAGRVIDLWMPTAEQCFAFGNPKVLVVIE